MKGYEDKTMEEKIIEYYVDNNCALLKTARNFKVGERTLKTMLINAGVYVSRAEMLKKLNEENKDIIVKFCNNFDGKPTRKEIAKGTGFSVSKVCCLVKKFGLDGFVADDNNKIENDENEKLVRSLSHLTIKEISEITGLKKNYISSLCYNRKIDVQKKENDESLCWSCKNFCKCQWSQKGQPIRNWVADETRIRNKYHQVVDGYMVRKCPLFEADEIGEARKIILKIYEKLDGSSKRPRQICKVLHINPKTLDILNQEYSLKKLMNCEIVIDENVKTFEVEE